MAANTDGLRQRANATGNGTKLATTEQGREIDQRLDKHESYVALWLC